MEPKFVQEYVNAQFKDGRSFSITELGGDKIGIDIFTDGVLQEVYMDREALVALLATAYIYFSLKKEVEELKKGVPMQPVPQDRDGKCWVLQPDGSWKESAWVKMPPGKVMYCGSEPTFQMTGAVVNYNPDNPAHP